MPVVEIVCLANSNKRGDRCVAGLRTDGGGWVRPLGSGEDGALRYPEYVLRGRGYAQLLDVIGLPLDRPTPQPNQPENWTLGRGDWELVARPAGPEVVPMLRAYLTRGPGLLGSEADRVPWADLEGRPADASLALASPRDVRWVVQARQAGGTHVRAVFTLKGAAYDLSVTDPVWLQRLGRLAPGQHTTAEAGLPPETRLLLTISLGEPYNGDCYKLVAGVIPIPPEWRRR